MNRRKKYGQHFLTSASIAKFIVNISKITENDLIYEVGTGKGILTPLLCKHAKHVVSIEIYKKLYADALEKFSNITNLTVKNGDGFKNTEKFDIFVSNLPYSKSRIAIQWLMQKKFSNAVIMVQDDFAEKLLATKKDRKAISVLSQYGFDMKVIKKVKNTNFFPQPKVNSVILQIKQHNILTKELIESVNMLFSYRRKTIQNIMNNFDIKIKSEMRLEDMKNNEIIKLAKKISKI